MASAFGPSHVCGLQGMLQAFRNRILALYVASNAALIVFAHSAPVTLPFGLATSTWIVRAMVAAILLLLLIRVMASTMHKLGRACW